jgi:hypothetical protein
MGTEAEVRKHEPECFDNYDRRSCLTCKHRGYQSIHQIKCAYGKELPEDKILEFCPQYERREREETFTDIFSGLFGGI